MNKITLKQKQKAVEIAISGGNPIEYLRSCGSTAPDKLWCYIKTVLKKKEPETFAKIPDLRRKNPKAPEAEAALATVKIDRPLRIETPETNKVEVVETPERQIGGLCPPPEVEDDRLFHTAAVRSKKLGTFYYDDKHGTIDWRHPYGEEISLFPEDYRLLRDSIDMILHTLGV